MAWMTLALSPLALTNTPLSRADRAEEAINAASGPRIKAEGMPPFVGRESVFALTLCFKPPSLSLDALTRPCTAPHPTTGRTMGRTRRIEYFGDNALKAG